jgi:ABC-type Na+ efflux pump permease subunit
MRQFIQMTLAEVRMALKNFYAVYVSVVPLVILIVLRFFLPSVESTTVTVAVVGSGPNAVEEELVESMEPYADILTYESVQEVEQKLRAAGSAEGLYWDPEAEQYVSLLERNVSENALFSVGARAVRLFAAQRRDGTEPSIVEYSHGVPTELSDRTRNPPVATIGGAIFIAYMTILMGFIIGLSVVRDKELGTDRAIKVSPVTRLENYAAKSVMPIVVLLVYAGVALVMLGLTNVSVMQIYTVTLVSVSVTLIFGLVVGALARNETEALGLVKSLGMVLMLGLLGGALLPDNWQWVVYWVPIYWTFDVAEEIFTLTATWDAVAWKSGVALGISLLAYGVLQKRIARGLS